VRQGNKALWICLWVLTACTAIAVSAVAQPILKIEGSERTWDVSTEKKFEGGIQIGVTAEHEFLLENAGTEPLEITAATSKAPCVTAVLPDEAIAPGKRGLLKVVLNTEGLEPGAIEALVVLKTNDPATATKPVVLTVKASVVPRPETLLLVDPLERNIGVVQVGQTRKFTYKYQNAGSEEYEIYPLYFVDKRFRIVKNIEREVLKPGAPKEFEVEFTPRAVDAGTELDAIVVIKTSSETLPRVVCRVRGYVAPAEKKPEGVQIVPTFFGGEKPRYFFRVVNNTAHAIEVVVLRDAEEFDRLELKAGTRKGFETPVAAEEDLKAITFQVRLLHEAPAAEAPEGETTAPEGGSTEGTTDTEPAGEGG